MNFKSIVRFSIGPVASAGLGVITVPLVAWLFTPEDIGRVAILQVTVGFSILIFSLGLDQAYVREYYETTNTPKLLKNTFFPGLMVLLPIGAVILIFPSQTGAFLFDIRSAMLGVLVFVYILCSFINRFLSLILRMKERGMAYSLSYMLPKIIFLVLVLIIVSFETTPVFAGLLLAHTVSVFFAFLFLMRSTCGEWKKAINQSVDRKIIKTMSKYSIPLVFSSFAYWGLTSVDKIFLRVFSDLEELGVYSVAVSLASAATIFQGIFSVVWAPIVYKWVAGNHDLEKVNRVSTCILLMVCLIFSLSGMVSWVFRYILPDSYETVQHIVVTCLSVPLLYTLSEATSIGINIARKTKYSLIATLGACVANVIGNYLLVPAYGAAGAAVSTACSFWAFFFLRTEFSSKVWKKMPTQAHYSLTLACVVWSSLAAFFKQSAHPIFLSGWCIVLTISGFLSVRTWISIKKTV